MPDRLAFTLEYDPCADETDIADVAVVGPSGDLEFNTPSAESPPCNTRVCACAHARMCA